MTEKLEAKSQLIEKTAFAVLPILFTCVVYLMSALDKLTHDVTVLNAKISLVVTSDNKQAANSGQNWRGRSCVRTWKKKSSTTVT